MTTLWGLERFFGWLVQTSWQAAVIVVLILLVQVLFRNRLSPAFRHGLWLVLVARLLMPMTPHSAISVFNVVKWHREPAPIAVTLPASRPDVDLTGPVPAVPANSADFISASAPGVKAERGVFTQVSTSSSSAVTESLPAMTVKAGAWAKLDWRVVAAIVWFSGAFLLLARMLCSHYAFHRRLRRCAWAPEKSVRNLLEDCGELLGIKHSLLVETDEVESPAVYGLWRKRLLLPNGLAQELAADELRHVFLHELAHIKRRDPELNWLLAVLQILHWFNPVLWFAFSRMRADREIATDELALQHARGSNRSAYGETLVKVLEGISRRRALPGLVGIGESKARIKERIRAIAQDGTGRHWRWVAVVVASIVAGVALTSAREDGGSKGVNLLERYPTTLKAGDASPGHARPWRFSDEDIFLVSRFSLEIAKQLRLELGPSDLGIGHCTDGAVWALLIPREPGKLSSSAATNEEIAHVWFRFHPAEINALFAPETVSGPGSPNVEEKMRVIAAAKFHSSWHAGNNAMIPEPKDVTVDADTRNGPRRFFVVDKQAQTAEYVAAFAGRSVKPDNQPSSQRELDTNCARVVAVFPANGATHVDPIQELRVRFDRPMDPHFLKLEWIDGGFQLNGSIRVADDQTEFLIPVRLTPGQDQKLVINHDREWERWQMTGARPDMKPSSTSRPKEGFLDDALVPANEFRWSFSTKPESTRPEAPKPRAVNVSPASGSATPVLTMIEVTFDQPMRSPEVLFPYLQQQTRRMEGPILIPNFEYDATAHRFTFPALLRPDDDVRLTLRGFSSVDGVTAEPLVLHYQTGSANLDAAYLKRAKDAAKQPVLQKLLASMKEARARLTSGVETVQTIRLGFAKNAYSSLDAQTATFKWQGADRVYADFSGPMSMKAFILGNDGHKCWLYSVNEKDEKRLDTTPADITQKEISLLDPFDLASRSIPDVLEERSVVSGSDAQLDGRRCHRVQSWDVNTDNFVYATLTEWWIDAETFLPRQLVQYAPNTCQIVRFDFKDLNQHFPDTAFQPPIASGSGAQPLFFKNSPDADEKRFIRVVDGANGRMSGRLGWRSSSGTTSSGLN